MFHTSFLSLSLLLAASSAAAQAPDSTSAKHQLGLTASPQLDHFFTANRSLPLGLLYKRQVKPGQAIRVRVVGQYSRRDTTDYAGTLPGSSNRFWEVNGFVGYQWQWPVERHTSLYYGADLGTGGSRRTTRDVRSGQDTNGDYHYDATYVSKQWQIELRPFLGVEVKFSERVALLAESAVSGAYKRRRDDYNGTGTRTYPNGPTVPTGAVHAYRNSNAWQLRWRPVQLIGIVLTL